VSAAAASDPAFSDQAFGDESADVAASVGSDTGSGVASHDASHREASLQPSTRTTRLSLSIRTSLLCEFRTASGVLQAFEVCPGQTTFGVLCSTLARMPGVEFPGHDPLDWFTRPSRFTFRGELYEVSIPYDNIRVCPADIGKPVIEMEELLEYVRHNVLKPKVAR
jgi:hypothetical protein